MSLPKRDTSNPEKNGYIKRVRATDTSLTVSEKPLLTEYLAQRCPQRPMISISLARQKLKTAFYSEGRDMDDLYHIKALQRIKQYLLMRIQ